MSADEIGKIKTEVETIKLLLQKIVNPEGKIELNLSIEELVVLASHKDRVVNLDANSVAGKILACALLELVDKTTKKPEPFTESELSDVLSERGCPMGHGTLAPSLADLVDQGLLIADKHAKPYKYRLPSKVTFKDARQNE